MFVYYLSQQRISYRW